MVRMYGGWPQYTTDLSELKNAKSVSMFRKLYIVGVCVQETVKFRPVFFESCTLSANVSRKLHSWPLRSETYIYDVLDVKMSLWPENITMFLDIRAQ